MNRSLRLKSQAVIFNYSKCAYRLHMRWISCEWCMHSFMLFLVEFLFFHQMISNNSYNYKAQTLSRPLAVLHIIGCGKETRKMHYRFPFLLILHPKSLVRAIGQVEIPGPWINTKPFFSQSSASILLSKPTYTDLSTKHWNCCGRTL